MRHYLIKFLAASMLLVLAGCQTFTGGGNSFFSSYPSGATLAQAVEDALFRYEDPVIAQVHVETNQNTVILSGYVKKIRQSDTAEQIARQVPGVQSVENNIIVRQ